MYSMVTLVNSALFYIWKLLIRIDFKSSHHKKKMCNYMRVKLYCTPKTNININVNYISV